MTDPIYPGPPSPSKLFTKQHFGQNQIKSISIGECNTILSAYTMYRHLE